MAENETFSWKPKEPDKKPDMSKILRAAVIVVVIAVIAFGAMSCFYTVDDKQQAVVTTFGKVPTSPTPVSTSNYLLASRRSIRWT